MKEELSQRVLQAKNLIEIISKYDNNLAIQLESKLDVLLNEFNEECKEFKNDKNILKLKTMYNIEIDFVVKLETFLEEHSYLKLLYEIEEYFKKEENDYNEMISKYNEMSNSLSQIVNRLEIEKTVELTNKKYEKLYQIFTKAVLEKRELPHLDQDDIEQIKIILLKDLMAINPKFSTQINESNIKEYIEYINQFNKTQNELLKKSKKGILSKIFKKEKPYEMTFLTSKQVHGNKKIDIIKKYGLACSITDFAILLGGNVSEKNKTFEGQNTGTWRVTTPYEYLGLITESGDLKFSDCYYNRDEGNRPVVPYSSISSLVVKETTVFDGIKEIEYGEYPQTVVEKEDSKKLERLYLDETLRKTGKTYTTDQEQCTRNTIYRTPQFSIQKHIEYELDNEKYIRFVVDLDSLEEDTVLNKKLSDGRTITNKSNGMVFWVKVEPIKWLVDEVADIALCKKIMFAGIPFEMTENYDKKFNKTIVKKFMDYYFSKEIIANKTYSNNQDLGEQEKKVKR